MPEKTTGILALTSKFSTPSFNERFAGLEAIKRINPYANRCGRLHSQRSL
jgi:hypothetical protein